MSEDKRDPLTTLTNAKAAFVTIAVFVLIACAPALIWGCWAWALGR